jgi:hypothetical protein
MTEQESEKLDLLISQAGTLMAEVGEIASSSGKQFVSLADTARRNRRMIWFMAAGGALLTLVVVGLILSLLAVRSNTDRIDGITKQINATNTVQRQRALCPLYQILKDSESPEGRAAAPDPKKYDHAFDVIQKGYDVLECSSFKSNY